MKVHLWWEWRLFVALMWIFDGVLGQCWYLDSASVHPRKISWTRIVLGRPVHRYAEGSRQLVFDSESFPALEILSS